MKKLMTRSAVMLFATLCLLNGARAQVTVLYNFGTHTNDPEHPNNPGFVAQGRDGNLYSTSTSGGTDGDGTVFKITPAGQVSVLYNFNGTDGGFPKSGLTLGTDGNFYGSTYDGGPSTYGSVFKVTSKGVFTLLHGFDFSDGSNPWGAPVEGTNGDFYGTTEGGGSASCGTVYRVTAGGVFKILYNFTGTFGCQPFAPLVLGTDGNFYGTTVTGGNTPDAGAVFKITPTGTVTLVHSFEVTDGSGPYAPLMQASDGNFYGTTYNGGQYGSGGVFEVSPSGGLFKVLADFDPNTTGIEPYSGLVEGTNGFLYGTTTSGGTSNQGTIYSIAVGGGGFAVLYSFDGTTGIFPDAGLMQHTDGYFFSDCESGGSDSLGTFYQFNASLLPFVRLVPTSAKVGKTVGILGQGLTSTTAVSFNGTAAVFHKTSETYLTATVPSGATSGFVTVVTSSGTSESNQVFNVIP